MQRPVKSAQLRAISACPARGYTLVEILVATALTLIMVAAVVQIFGSIGESINESRTTLEMSEGVRTAKTRLEMDLAGITVTMLPPRRPETYEGYFEYIEGPIGALPTSHPAYRPRPVDVDVDPTNPPADTTVGDFDDILMFTTQSTGRPFLGRCAGAPEGVIESDVAEIAWFVRGRTLYRRMLLVAPAAPIADDTPVGFFAENDISVHVLFDSSNKPIRVVANSLGDLTKRECRFAHRVHGKMTFPFDMRRWGQLGLPTLRECSSPRWFAWQSPAEVPRVSPKPWIDLWNDPHPWHDDPRFPVDKVTGTLIGFEGPRVAEDVILNNVIGFDVKAWDPGAPVLLDSKNTPEQEDDVVVAPGDPSYPANPARLSSGWSVLSYGAYVDLGYAPRYNAPQGAPQPAFHVPNYDYAAPGPRSSLPRVYDTWSFHYEQDWQDENGNGKLDQGEHGDQYLDGVGDLGTNGFDDDQPGQPGYGIVDDPGEMETSPPYPVPLRGIQIKIRVFESDSNEIREVTVVQDFLPK